MFSTKKSVKSHVLRFLGITGRPKFGADQNADYTLSDKKSAEHAHDITGTPLLAAKTLAVAAAEQQAGPTMRSTPNASSRVSVAS